MASLIMKYQDRLGDPHEHDPSSPNLKSIDFYLRQSIGKTEDIKIAKASHNVVKSMERGEHYCRVCGKNLDIVGVGRVNDYLLLRHPYCKAPICLDCRDNNPDAFYLALEHGVNTVLYPWHKHHLRY